jgi:hypothetical protein
MKPTKPFIDYKGVKIFHSYKGSVALTFWYALEPRHQAERDGRDFDVRRLPQKYRAGLTIESLNGNPTADFFAEQAACKETIRRAIDDNYDFKAATKGKYMPRWRSLIERMSGRFR